VEGLLEAGTDASFIGGKYFSTMDKKPLLPHKEGVI
jgi:hypothetical protein